MRDTEAWIVDIMNPYGDQTWEVEPTPIAELPDNIIQLIRANIRSRMVQERAQASTMQGVPFDASQVLEQMDAMEEIIKKDVEKRAQVVAKKRSNNMKLKILDQLEQGGWNEALKACQSDMSRMKSCIMKGPVFKRMPTIKWGQDENGKWVPNYSEEISPTFHRVSPFDWFPAPKSSTVQQGDAIEIERLTPDDLRRVMNEGGYYSDNIRRILTDMPNGFKENLSVDVERQSLEKDNTITDSTTDILFDMLNYWGTVSGASLSIYNMTDNYGEPLVDDKFYKVNIKVINNTLIKAPIVNPDPLGQKPYGVTSFIKNNDSQWGECPAELMKDLQSICNATVRALVNNIAISSGPLTEIDVNRLAPGESGELWPHKRILTNNAKMQDSPAVRFYQSKILANELMAVYEKFKREADDIVVPSYGRTNIGGAGRTSSGLAMVMSAAARNVKLAVYNMDQDVIVTAIQRLFNYNMLFIDDDSIKGDIRIKARGTSGIIAKEQLAVRRNEFRATLGPNEIQLMGAPGVAYLLRKNVEALDMAPDKIMPNYKDAESGDIELIPMQPQGGSGVPAQSKVLDVAGQPAGGADDTSLFRESEKPSNEEG